MILIWPFRIPRSLSKYSVTRAHIPVSSIGPLLIIFGAKLIWVEAIEVTPHVSKTKMPFEDNSRFEWWELMLEEGAVGQAVDSYSRWTEARRVWSCALVRSRVLVKNQFKYEIMNPGAKLPVYSVH